MAFVHARAPYTHEKHGFSQKSAASPFWETAALKYFIVFPR
jgi:hypothetical protein